MTKEEVLKMAEFYKEYRTNLRFDVEWRSLDNFETSAHAAEWGARYENGRLLPLIVTLVTERDRYQQQAAILDDAVDSLKVESDALAVSNRNLVEAVNLFREYAPYPMKYSAEALAANKELMEKLK